MFFGALRSTAFALLVAFTAPIPAWAAKVPSPDVLLEEIREYGAAASRPSFQSFVRRYGRSAELEAAVWQLTLDQDALATLKEIFGRSDPWWYRRAAKPSSFPDRN